ncbi:MAG: EsaB/YukD family protein, partial [Stackebrandtia sp.]
MPGQYSTVTLVGPRTTRDLALPGNVPIAQLLPQLLRPGVMRSDVHEGPATWMLTTVDGRRLSGGSTLTELGIGDGEVLHLHDATDAVITPPVEDVRDAVEDLTDANGKSWKAGTGRVFATGVAALVVAGTAVIGGGTTAVLMTGGLVCVLAVLVTWWSARDNTMLAHLALTGGAMWAIRVGYEGTAAIAPEGLAGEPIRWVFGLCAALLVTVLGLIGTPLAIP